MSARWLGPLALAARPGALVGLGAVLLIEAAAAEPRHGVLQKFGVRARMRDGVVLFADLYRPDAEGTFPVLLQRTPYDRKRAWAEARRLASHGYVVVIQDTRGRYASQGHFYPFRHESADGYDTVEWAAELPGSNGRVGMYGGSYAGITQMMAAIAKPPHLVAIFPYLTTSEAYDAFLYQGGAFMQWFASSWTHGLAEDALQRRIRRPRRLKRWIGKLPIDGYHFLRLPPAEVVAPWFAHWIEHESDDEYWKPWRASDHYAELDLKALHGAGWYDIFLLGSLRNYIGMRASAATPEARAAQRLLVGPWPHGSVWPGGRAGDVVFGEEAVLDFVELVRAWSDWSLRGIENEYASGPPVRIFVMGDGVWRREDTFPLQRQKITRYYLHAARGANSVRGDGALSTEHPGDEAPDRFSYDPSRPVLTLGGRLCCENDVLLPGPVDQRPNEGRSDVLVYSSAALARDLEVTGFVRLELYAATTATDTDFTAMLVDVEPSGNARLLTDGIVRARYRNSTARPEPLVPGKIHRYEIDLWATSHVFGAGHRIRLYVSSSNFPRFSRNLNTGEPLAGATRMTTANQTIYHDADHPSALLLPVIPR